MHPMYINADTFCAVTAEGGPYICPQTNEECGPLKRLNFENVGNPNTTKNERCFGPENRDCRKDRGIRRCDIDVRDTKNPNWME